MTTDPIQQHQTRRGRGFVTRCWRLPPDTRLHCEPHDWRDALIVVAAGDVDVISGDERRRFTTGAMLTVSRLAPPVRLINPGVHDAVFVTIHRIGSRPARPAHEAGRARAIPSPPQRRHIV